MYSFQKVALPIAITIGSLIIGYFQIKSTEKIALNEQRMKMWDLFSQDLLNVNYNEEVWETEGTVRLLGAMLSDTSILADESLIKLARAIYKESINTSIAQFHRTEEIRIAAARVIASMYHIDKRYVIERLIKEIKEDTSYPGYFRINGAILITIAKIPGYWEGTVEQYNKVYRLKHAKILGEYGKTNSYKKGWLINEVLNKWKEIK